MDDIRSVSTEEEFRQVVDISKEITIESDDPWDNVRFESKLEEYGISYVEGSNGDRIYYTIENVNRNPTGGASWGNAILSCEQSPNSEYGIKFKTVSQGLGLTPKDITTTDPWNEQQPVRYNIYADPIEQSGKIYAPVTLPEVGQSIRTFTKGIGDSIADGVFDGNTVGFVYDYITGGGIRGYINRKTYENAVQYMIDKHLITTINSEYVEPYHNHTLTINGGITDNPSSMGYECVSYWLQHTDVPSERIPVPAFIRRLVDVATTRIRTDYKELTGNAGDSNFYLYRVSGTKEQEVMYIDLLAYYFPNGTSVTDPNFTSTYNYIQNTSAPVGSKKMRAITYTIRTKDVFVDGEWHHKGETKLVEDSIRTTYIFSPQPNRINSQFGIGGFTVFAGGTGSCSYSNFGMSGEVHDEIPEGIPLENIPDFAPIFTTDSEPLTVDVVVNTLNREEKNIPYYDPVSNTFINNYYIQINIPQTDYTYIINNGTDNVYKYNTPPKVPTESDIGNIVPPPSSVVTGESNALYTIYNPTQGEIESFGGWLWSSNVIEILKTVFQNPLDAVLSLQIIYGIPSIGGRREIKCGYLGSGVESNYVNNQYITVDCGAVNLFEFYGDARDYAPYTEVQLFLPFIGFVALDVYEVMASVMNITYIIDVLTGTCIASIKVSRDGTQKVLYSFNGNCAVQLPLSSADKSTLITGAVSGALSGAGMGMHFGGVGTAVGAVAGAVIGGATSGISINRSGNMSGNAGALGIKKPYLLVKRYKTHTAVGYGGLLGVADSYRCRIGDMTGFTQFTGIKLKVSATETELKEIETLLTDGVFV